MIIEININEKTYKNCLKYIEDGQTFEEYVNQIIEEDTEIKISCRYKIRSKKK
jgi:hypothetical protein